MPFPGAVGFERLQELRSLETETEALDYKQAVDLTDPASKYEFIKNCAAMMSCPQGGYLVLGVDGSGKPVDHDMDPASFDEARLRQLLMKHLEGDVRLLSAKHDVDGRTIILIFLDRRPDLLFPIVKADFTYPDARGKEQYPLRAGDVFVRDGTITRRWRSGDLGRLLAPHVEAARREERDRLDEIEERLRKSFQAQALSQGPMAGVTWQLGADDFNTAVAELSRRRDTAALRLLSLELQRDAVALMESPDADAPGRLEDLLDRAASALAYAVVLGDRELLDRVLGSLIRIYRHRLLDGQPTSDRSVETMLAIASRILATIALAVRVEEWWAVRPLALQPVGDSFDLRLAGLYDAAEEGYVRRGLERAGVGADLARADLEGLGFFGCDADLEDELIRALGTVAVQGVIEAQGELGSFRTMQKQPAQRGRSTEEQLRRFMGTRSGRKHHYARALVLALDLTRVPAALDQVLVHVASPVRRAPGPGRTRLSR